MQETRARINQLDEEMKKQTQDTLKAVFDNYQKILLDRIATELSLVDEFRSQGNAIEVNRHFQLAEIFKSILDSHVLYEPITKNEDSTTIANGDSSGISNNGSELNSDNRR
jgi:hypothetical protein